MKDKRLCGEICLIIEDAKEYTKPGGIHIIHTFTNTVPASPDIAPFAVGLADEGEILDLYSDWEVLQFKTYVFDDEHPNVPKHQHAVNKLVARKKRPADIIMMLDKYRNNSSYSG